MPFFPLKQGIGLTNLWKQAKKNVEKKADKHTGPQDPWTPGLYPIKAVYSSKTKPRLGYENRPMPRQERFRSDVRKNFQVKYENHGVH